MMSDDQRERWGWDKGTWDNGISAKNEIFSRDLPRFIVYKFVS